MRPGRFGLMWRGRLSMLQHVQLVGRGVLNDLGLLLAILDVLISSLLTKLPQAIGTLNARKQLWPSLDVTLGHLFFSNFLGTSLSLFLDLSQRGLNGLVIQLTITTETCYDVCASSNKTKCSYSMGLASTNWCRTTYLFLEIAAVGIRNNRLIYQAAFLKPIICRVSSCWSSHWDPLSSAAISICVQRGNIATRARLEGALACERFIGFSSQERTFTLLLNFGDDIRCHKLIQGVLGTYNFLQL